MTDKTVADKTRLAGLLIGRAFRLAMNGLCQPARYIALSPMRPPTRLLIAPQDIRTADPTVAADIYAGYFVFDGKAINAKGRSPFSIEAPNPAWAEAMAGFGWLRHLRAADTALARANARALVGDWINQADRPRDVPAWNPVVVARRILSWLSQSPIILEEADSFFYKKFMRSLGRQALYLQRSICGGLEGEGRLFAAIALTELGLCADGFGKLQRQATRILVEEIGTQILADGGHVSRNPCILADLLLDLLPLRQAFAARGTTVPPTLLNAIDRMMPMVRTFRHGDGSLALFNGMGVTQPEKLATVLAYDDVRGQPLTNAPYSGYQRLEGGPAVLIMDSGRPPPLSFAQRAHAGTLAFEFSVGPQRFIVNCGAPDPNQIAARQAARATAAHSTLVLADRSSSRFAATTPLYRWLGGAILAGPNHVPVARSQGPDGTLVEASHDGYLSRLGFIHHRRLFLAADGDRLDGEDRLSRGVQNASEQGAAAAHQPFAIRFHLHHALRLQLIRHGAAAFIAFPTGELWIFEAGGHPIEVEESIYFASAEGPRRIEQLVLRGHTKDLSTPILVAVAKRTARIGFNDPGSSRRCQLRRDGGGTAGDEHLSRGGGMLHDRFVAGHDTAADDMRGWRRELRQVPGRRRNRPPCCDPRLRRGFRNGGLRNLGLGVRNRDFRRRRRFRLGGPAFLHRRPGFPCVRRGFRTGPGGLIAPPRSPYGPC